MNTVAVSAIFDVGKTNVKLCLLDDSGRAQWSRSRRNAVVDADPYPHFDVDALWHWLLATLAEAGEQFDIRSVNVSTHGACAALVDATGELALPVPDYEFTGFEDCGAAYDAVRPTFDDTYSPGLPAGLNLGRQLFWLRQHFPGEFERAARVLLYPQYWTWRLSGVAASEVTSLGCHTDLWRPEAGDYSALVDTLAIRDRLPPLRRATDSVGTVSADVAESTGLSPDCRVYAGVHDSNASLARHMCAGLKSPFAVVSTGTWVISMALCSDLAALDEQRDCLANVSVLAAPVACARFMGGREFEEICRLTASEVDGDCCEDDIAELVAADAFALPAFAAGGGPFMGRRGTLPEATGKGPALATLYLAMMIDYELDLLQAQGDIVFGSASEKNPLLCRMLAQLRPRQAVLLSGDAASTVSGAWCLTRPTFPRVELQGAYTRASPTAVQGLPSYRDAWRRQL